MTESPNVSVDSDVLIDKMAEKLDSVTRLDSELSDLPNEILGEIVENLDLVSRLKTRKVSRRLRSVVDNQKAYYDIIYICTEKNQIHILFDKVMVHYGKSGCLLDKENHDESSDNKVIENINFMEIAVNDLTIVLQKPKFHLKSLEMSFNIDADAETAKILKLIQILKYSIHVKSLFIENDGNHDVLPILSLFKPGTLEDIDLRGMNKGINADELVKMEQWKQAKKVSLGEIPLQFEDFLHFDEFKLHVNSISTQDVLRLREILSKSINFKKCRLDIPRNDSMNIEEIGRALGARVAVFRHFYSRFINHRHQIPGSNEFLYFEIYPKRLYIRRTR